MKYLTTLTLGILLSFNLFGQEDKVKELVSQGVFLHDQGRYDDAIAKYIAALEIDKSSTTAMYELAYTYMTIEKYNEAIKYCKKVIEQNSNNQQEAYIVLGTSYDMSGYPDKAINAYEEGLSKFPGSNLLNYNLALTAYNQKDYEKAEKAAINAILIRPEHGSSHLLLSAIMESKGERLKSLLPLYYFLMLEPNSKRSKSNYLRLNDLLAQGVNQENNEKVNVNISLSSTKDSDFGAAEMMLSLLAASKYIEENKGKSDMEFFVETTQKIFSFLGEKKKENKGFWWDLYVTKFYNLVLSNNYEAFCYYISQSLNSSEINKWIEDNQDKMEKYENWLNQ
jgi:Flp pilus assembly protein TadD